MDSETTQRLLKAATDRGLKVRALGPHEDHIQIVGGPLLVNYYPDSKKRSAYVAGTTERRTNVTPEQAVEMAITIPKPGLTKGKRLNSSPERRRKIVRDIRSRKGDFCHWCHARMLFRDDEGYHQNSPLSATIEHVIPLGIGGLDNANNRVLAHKKCNHERGSNMPELEGKGA
jgi:hypothetical protein